MPAMPGQHFLSIMPVPAPTYPPQPPPPSPKTLLHSHTRRQQTYPLYCVYRPAYGRRRHLVPCLQDHPSLLSFQSYLSERGLYLIGWEKEEQTLPTQAWQAVGGQGQGRTFATPAFLLLIPAKPAVSVDITTLLAVRDVVSSPNLYCAHCNLSHT